MKMDPERGMFSCEAESSILSSSKSDLLHLPGAGHGVGENGQLLSPHNILRDVWIATLECQMLPRPTSQGPTPS